MEVKLKIHHIGYAVKDIDQGIESFKKLGYKVSHKTKDYDRKVLIAFAMNDDLAVELIAPMGVGSPIDNILAKNGPSPYHICYEVADIGASCDELKREGWLILGKPSAAPGIICKGNAEVVFLYNKNVGIIELVEIKTNNRKV